MDENGVHAERVGDEAGVLAAGRAEALQGVGGDVVAAFDGDAPDRGGHVLDADADCTVGNLMGREAAAHIARKIFECRLHGIAIGRQISGGSEYVREAYGIELAEQHVGVGEGQWAALAIAEWAWIGAGALGPDAQAAIVEADDGTAPGRHGVDVEHRHAQAHARDFRLEGAFIGAGEVGDVGRCAAHVESDDPVEAGGAGRFGHGDDAAGGA